MRIRPREMRGGAQLLTTAEKMTVTIVKAFPNEAADILRLQKHAYLSEAEIYDDFGIPPLVETEDELREEFRDHLVLKAEGDSGIVGSVRGSMQGDTCLIERLIVNPELQNQGIGQRLLAAIEESFPQARRFEIFTGHKSERNLHLYEKMGYREFRRDRINHGLTLVYLEKENPESE